MTNNSHDQALAFDIVTVREVGAGTSQQVVDFKSKSLNGQVNLVIGDCIYVSESSWTYYFASAVQIYLKSADSQTRHI